MKLSDIAIRRPVTTIMCVLMVILLGAVSLSNLALDLLPNITFPIAVVSIDYEGAGPREVESLITDPVESVLGTVGNIKSVSSVSSEGNATIVAEFNFGTDMDFAILDIREKVDLIKAFLPEGISTPFILKLDPNLMAIMQLGITGEMDQAGLKSVVEDEIKPRLERLEGVASVSAFGGLEREIRVEVYPERLKGYGLSLAQIVQALRAENLNLPGGSVDDGHKRYILRTAGEFQSVEEIENIPVNLPAGGIVYLKDVADVKDTFKEITSQVNMNGRPCIGLEIRKESTANTVQVARRINRELDLIRKEYQELQVGTIVDTSSYIEKAISNVAGVGIFGAFLAVAVLYLFLRNIRTTFIIGAAIPISVIATFTLVYLNGLTLNLMSMGGLALGVGMLVDNSIVVLENIYRYRQEGYSRLDAAREGSGEIAMAVTASTLTTIAVFAPIVFVQGIAAELFREMALTVTFSLLVSLVVSLTLVPMLSSKILKVDRGGRQRFRVRFVSRALDLWNIAFERIGSIYSRLLGWALRNRKKAMAAMLVLFVLSLASLSIVGAEFIPDMDQGYVTVSIKLPTGTVLEETSRVTGEVESIMGSIPEMENVFVVLGSSGEMMSTGSQVDTASAIIYGKLKPLDQRERSSFEVADWIRQQVSGIPGARIEVQSMGTMAAFGGGTPVDIEIKGDDLDVLGDIAEDIKEIVKQVEGTREVKSSLDEGKPEARIRVDRRRASLYGLNVAAVASAVQAAVDGQVASRYRVGGDEVDIRVCLGREFAGADSLKDLVIASPMGYQVPLSEVAEVRIEEGPVQINRTGQVRVVSVTADVFGRDLRSVMTDIHARANKYPLPPGYTVEYGGENKEMVDAFIDLSMALALAVVLVYMIMASQFESLVHPFTIMFSVPFGLTGAIGALVITGRTLSVPAFIGIIMLAGIVVNNAIVLVDYINTLRSRGEDRDQAILKAGPVRLRPIFMTALTTVLGLLPMAFGFGEGAEVRAPMATAVIGGLLFSTLLTLIIVPVMYTIVDDLGSRIRVTIFKRRSINLSE